MRRPCDVHREGAASGVFDRRRKGRHAHGIYTRLGDSAQRDEDTCMLFFNDRLDTLPWFIANA